MSGEPPEVHPRVEKQLDAIDAAVFSGDTLFTPKAIERLRWYMARWERACVDRLLDCSCAGIDLDAGHESSCVRFQPETEGRAEVTIDQKKRLAAYLIEHVCDIPDRTSPDDQPEMMLVTGEELENALLCAFERYEADGEVKS